MKKVCWRELRNFTPRLVLLVTILFSGQTLQTQQDLFEFEKSLTVGSPVLTVAWSPDGSKLASGSEDYPPIEIWDASGQELQTFPGYKETGTIFSVSWSPDGRRLASGSGDGSTHIWDATDLDKRRYDRRQRKLYSRPTINPYGIASVAWSPDGRRVASGSGDKTIEISDASTGMVVEILTGHTQGVSSVAWSPDGRRLASGSRDGTIRIWDAKTGVPLLRLTGHAAPVYSVAWSPDSNKLASGSSDGKIKIWDASTSRIKLLETLTGHADSVVSVVWSPDSSKLASGSDDKTIKIWNAKTGEVLQTLTGGFTDDINSVAWSPDGTKLASGSSDSTIKIWHMREGALV